MICCFFNGFSQNIQEHSFDYGPDSLVFIDSSDLDNIWVIGHPDKPNTTSGCGSINAIYTDTLYYPTNDTSAFFINYTNHNIYYSIGVSFFYKIDSDSITDFGSIYVWDGSQWFDLIKDYKSIGYFVVKKVNTAELIYFSSANDSSSYNPFTGLSKGWYIFYYRLEIQHRWWPNNLEFRFKFTSDSVQTEREGWILDLITFEDINDLSADFQSDRKFELYPNPVNSTLRIYVNDFTNSKYSINIYTVTGQLVKTTSFNSNVSTIDLQELVSGIYLYSIYNSNEVLKTGLLNKN